jgi:hypothetical protein
MPSKRGDAGLAENDDSSIVTNAGKKACEYPPQVYLAG